MILKTQIRPDRFGRIVSGKKKEHRIPVQHIELTEKIYEVVIFTTSFSRQVLIELLSIEEDKQAGEYVLTLGKIKSMTDPLKKAKNKKDNTYHLQGKTKKEYIHKCEILRDGHKVGTLNLSTKQGRKQKSQLSNLQGYTFKDLPPELITH